MKLKPADIYVSLDNDLKRGDNELGSAGKTINLN